jgi:hypothetical protein
VRSPERKQTTVRPATTITLAILMVTIVAALVVQLVVSG